MTALVNAAYVTVIHEDYGCHSGCCGHRYIVWDSHGHKLDAGPLEFTHPYGEPIQSFIDSVAGMVARVRGIEINYALSEVVNDDD